MPPTLANGKICYIEMPATDIARSSDFYKRVFDWNIRKRGDGAIAFDDTTGEVSGAWVLGRPPATHPGLLFYIMVDSVAASVDTVIANGGEIVHPSARMRPRSPQDSAIPRETSLVCTNNQPDRRDLIRHRNRPIFRRQPNHRRSAPILNTPMLVIPSLPRIRANTRMTANR